jgi:histidinol-phosphate/aromatic aminotransferase/cobyric acid decarboxylase-like protein
MEQRNVRYVASLYGGFWDLDIKDHCYMTNPYFPPREFMESLGERLVELVKAYPSTNWHISSLAARPLGLTHEEVVIANGASELINAIISRFVDNLAVPVPTFDEFVNRAIAQGKSVSPYQLHGDFELDLEGFIQHVRDSQANAALIINPNNPTGTLLSQESLWHVLESLRHLDLIILDESFNDFVSHQPSPSAMERLLDFPNLIILKSLSKSYGIPGLRLGYAASGNQGMISDLRRDLPIWSINSLAQYFLEEIGNYGEQFSDSCDSVRRATQVLSSGLQSIPYLYPYPTQANFVLCRVLDDFTATELTARLFDESRMLINDCSRKKGLDGRFVRMASRTAEENTQLIQALQALATTSPVAERARA